MTDRDGCGPGYKRGDKWRCEKNSNVDIQQSTRKIGITYKGKPVDMDMLDDILRSFNKDLTIQQLRNFINIRDTDKNPEEEP